MKHACGNEIDVKKIIHIINHHLYKIERISFESHYSNRELTGEQLHKILSHKADIIEELRELEKLNA